MPFVQGVAEDSATGQLADFFAADRQSWGYLPNLARTFGIRPAVYHAWRQLNGAIKGTMDPRRYELVTGLDLARQEDRRGAADISDQDIAELRALGVSDEEIFDVIVAAAARCFFSKTLDATGTPPDAAFEQLSPILREALTVGRPIDTPDRT